jgi:hypothetical protein
MNKTATTISNTSVSFEPMQSIATDAGTNDDREIGWQPVNPDEESQGFLRLHF